MFRNREPDDLRQRLEHLERVVDELAAEVLDRHTTLGTEGEHPMMEPTSEKRWYDDRALNPKDRSAERNAWIFQTKGSLTRAHAALGRLLDPLEGAGGGTFIGLLTESPLWVEEKARPVEAALHEAIDAITELRAAATYFTQNPATSTLVELHTGVLG